MKKAPTTLLLFAKTLGKIDSFLTYFESAWLMILKLFSAVLAAILIVLFYSGFFSHPELLRDYLVQQVYASPSTLTDNSVLGLTTKRELPFLKTKLPKPFISAKSALVIDTKHNKVLFDKEKDMRLPPASTTKLLTALVALDLYDKSQIIKIPELCTQIDTTKAGLIGGKEYTVDQLLHALLISSAGDAACALSTAKIPSEDFVQLMDSRLIEFNLKDSHFSNPIGLDGVNGDHYSSAQDLFSLSQKFMENAYLRNIVTQKEYLLDSLPLENTNKLLSEVSGSIGIKTGTTAEAGEVLLYAYHKDDVELTIVVMGSTDRFTDTKTLLDWTLRSYSFTE